MSDGVNKPPSASPLPVPVLIVDSNPSVRDRLPPLLSSASPGIALRLCSSHGYAMHSLTIARYQVVVCGVQFAEAKNFLLLKQHRAFQSFVPFIVIAEAQDKTLAKCALEQGVEDIILASSQRSVGREPSGSHVALSNARNNRSSKTDPRYTAKLAGHPTRPKAPARPNV